MSKNIWKIIFNILLVIIFGLSGFYLGRKTYIVPKATTKVEYVEGKTIYKFTSLPVPFKLLCPADTVDIIRKCVEDGLYTELFPEKTKEKTIYVSKEDTTTIMRDWATERFYSEVLFNSDTLGKMTVNTEVQYNRIKNYSYEFTPKVKTTTQKNYVVKEFSPYIGFGVSFNPWDNTKDVMPKITAGIFIKEKVGFQMDFQHGINNKNNFIGGSFLVKF